VRFPMCDPPHLSKQDMLDWCSSLGITPPRLYRYGFSHNNCGGVCVRGGHKHWLRLLEVFPDRYAEAEHREQELRELLGDVAILRERRGGVSRPLTLTALRLRHPELDRTGHRAPRRPGRTVGAGAGPGRRSACRDQRRVHPRRN
jgi:hypothetical protein